MAEHFDAQRILERKALTNVRALVDKVEAQDREQPGEAIRFAVFGTLVILGVLACVYMVSSMMPSTRHDERKNTATMSVVEYTEHCLKRIEAVANDKRFPQTTGLDGRVEITFSIKANGYLQSVEITRSSWDSHVDGMAGRIVKLAEPFGPLPDVARKDTGVFPITRVLRFDRSGGHAGSLIVERSPTES